jgi:hypothetical protein
VARSAHALKWMKPTYDLLSIQRELDGNLSSISGSIDGSLPENTASCQARFNHEGRTICCAVIAIQFS